MKNTKNSIDRITILNRIFRYFICAFQWGNDNINSRLENFQKAEALIELLEVDDCGSVGGFDRDNPVKNVAGFRLFDRYLTVINKYEDLIRPNAGVTIGSLIEVAKRDICR